jgi:hypothetical protein
MSAIEKVWVIKNHQGLTIQDVGTPVNDTDVATKASAQAQATAAQTAAIEAAALDATTKADAAEEAAILAAASDAQTKADGAETAANAYTDSQVLNANATVLQDAKDYTDAEISALVGEGVSTALDTLKELGDALNSNESAVGALVISIGDVADDLADEITNRTNADTALQGDVNSLDGRLDSAESAITSLTNGKVSAFTGTISGPGTVVDGAYEYSLTHSLNKANVLVQVSEGNDVVDVKITKFNNNTTKITTGIALGATTLTVVVVG